MATCYMDFGYEFVLAWFYIKILQLGCEKPWIDQIKDLFVRL